MEIVGETTILIILIFLEFNLKMSALIDVATAAPVFNDLHFVHDISGGHPTFSRGNQRFFF